MDEHALRGLIAQVKDGELSRRSFMRHMVALGLTAPMAAQMLSFSGVPAEASTADTFKYKPTKRGGGGPLRVLYWQGPTVLNPHFATGLKEQEGSRIFHEPLARWDTEGNLAPVLAAEIPSHENGGLSEDGRSVIWKLKRGVQWHDGRPFTADDVVFNWQFASDPAAACVTLGTYRDVKVEKVDDYTVKVMFERPAPFWADAFVGTRGMLIPKHLYADYTGAKSREAPNNMKPVGTGPYKFVDFKPGDMV
jgi:peptide/nickel transport system substrate-binding protein